MNYRLIGAASGWGAQLRECEEAPEVLRDEQIVKKLRAQGIAVSEMQILYPERKAAEAFVPMPQALPFIRDFNLQLAKEVEAALQSGDFPIVVGGDHSIAVGTWNGVYRFFRNKKQLPMGLIWVDAHMDSHTLQTTITGAWHGMPVAGLLGYGEAGMAQLLQEAPVLLPENLCIIGARSYEEGEAQLLHRLKVRVYLENEVKARGFGEVFQEAVAHLTKLTPVFGVSLDLDVIRPAEAPGVGSPEEGGISAQELISTLSSLPKNERFQAFELVEYNPKLDIDKRTARLCLDILSQIVRKNS